MLYTMHRRVYAHGAVTGRQYRLGKGQEVEAPEGEFRHLSPEWYATRPLAPGVIPGASSAPSHHAEHTGAGWYEIRAGGETVAKIRGKDAADARLAELTGTAAPSD